MKKIILMLLMVIATTATFAKDQNENVFVVKQTLNFENSEDIVIYYVYENKEYKVYSETNLNKESPTKLENIVDFNVTIQETYKGDCYVTCKSIKEVLDLGTALYAKYGNHLKILQ